MSAPLSLLISSGLPVLDALSRHAAAVLISSLWEGVVLAALVSVCFLLVPNTTATLRFNLWVVVFGILTALPLLNAVVPYRATASVLVSAAPQLLLDSRWSYVLAGIWLVAVLFHSIHLALQAVRLRSLWRSAVPVVNGQGAHLDSEMWEVLRPAGLLFRLFPNSSKKVELCTSFDLDRPGVIGFFAPRILIPAWLFEELTPGELHQIVLHELEHLRRRDDWLNLLQKLALVLFPLNPGLLWIDRRLATERELACDDGVLHRTRAPRAYATCLTSLAERRLEHRHHGRLTLLALNAVGVIRRSDFSRRIESILGFEPGRRPRLRPATTRLFALLFIAGVLGSAAILARSPQLVAFTAATKNRPTVAQAIPAASRQPASARLENVVFDPAQPAAGNLPAAHRARKFAIKPRRISPAPAVDAVNLEATQRPDRRWMVLTSWQQSTPHPVLLTLPDGRTFLATYAAGQNQAGWLFIQL